MADIGLFCCTQDFRRGYRQSLRHAPFYALLVQSLFCILGISPFRAHYLYFKLCQAGIPVCVLLNIPDEFPSVVRRYGNHFLDSLLCILNHNFYRNIRKGCYAPQMRQGLDKYSHRNRTVIKHKKVISEYRNPDFQIYGFAISSRKNIHPMPRNRTGYPGGNLQYAIGKNLRKAERKGNALKITAGNPVKAGRFCENLKLPLDSHVT